MCLFVVKTQHLLLLGSPAVVCKVFRPFILHTLFPSFPSGYQSLFLPYSFFPAHVCFCLFVLTTRTHLAGEPCSSLNSLYSTFPYCTSLSLYLSITLLIYLSICRCLYLLSLFPFLSLSLLQFSFFPIYLLTHFQPISSMSLAFSALSLLIFFN